MKRIAAFMLLVALSLAAVPAQARRLTPDEDARQARKDAKGRQKTAKKAAKKQRKEMKKYAKAQREKQNLNHVAR
jgi:multidrug efflux pump subunit AcrB